MLRRKDKKKTYGTVLGEDMTIENSIKTTDDILHNGKIYGNITTEGALVIGPTGLVEGNIKAKSVIINGQVKGNIECSESINLQSKSNVEGNLQAKYLKVDDGAYFEGNCKISTNNITDNNTSDNDEDSINMM